MPNSSPLEYQYYIEKAAVLIDQGYVKDMSLYSLADLLERQDASLRQTHRVPANGPETSVRP